MIYALLVPVLFIAVTAFAAFRKVKVYDSFAEGVKGVLPLLKSLFPYLAAILILAELFEASGLSAALGRALAPAFSFLGIPQEVAPLVLVKPFSGSGSVALLSEIFEKYGADSYIARCASVVYASGETVFLPLRRLFCRLQKKTRAARRDRAARQFSRRGARLPAVPRAVNAEMKIIYSLTFSGRKGNVL